MAQPEFQNMVMTVAENVAMKQNYVSGMQQNSALDISAISGNKFDLEIPDFENVRNSNLFSVASNPNTKVHDIG